MSAAATQLALIPFATPQAGRPQRVGLTNAADDAQAEQRYQVILPLHDYRSDPARYFALKLRDGSPVTSYSRMVEYVAETSGVSRATLFNWLKAFKEGGRPALADRQRKDANTSRFFAAYPRAAWLAAYIHLECRLNVRVAHEAILRHRELLQIPIEDMPSYETVRAWLKSLPPSLTTYARLGKKAYREIMAPYLTRGYTDVYANQWWVGDHMIHDVECANDCFENIEWGAPVRIRFTAFLDFRSRMFVGGSWCWEGSSRSIVAAFMRAVNRFGLPDELYVDNGKDYRKIARGSLPGYLRESPLAPANWWRNEMDSFAASGFAARMGVSVTHCLPHHPQSKHIERAFGTCHGFDKYWPTYTSGNPFTRPESTELAMVQHRRLLKAGRVSESKHPLASKFILAFLAWLEEYNNTPHTGRGMDGGTPRQVFEANLNPNQKPAPGPDALALLMFERQTRLVRECAVTFNNRRYVPVDQTGWAVMHQANQREIVLAYDPLYRENAAALDADGNLLAWLQPEQLVRFAPGDKEVQAQIADSMATRKRLEKGNRETLAVVSRAVRGMGIVSPLEELVSRLQLPAGETGEGVITQRKPKLESASADPINTLIPGQAADRMAERIRRNSGHSS